MNEVARPRGGARRVLVMLFAIYLVLLVWLVLWKMHVPFIGRDDMRDIKLIPFVKGAGFGPSRPIEVLGNLMVFVPFGIYLGALAPTWRWWKVLAVVAGVSFGLEVIQFVTAVGSSDVTDVIVNAAGGLVGFALLVGVRRLLSARTGIVLAWVLATGTAVALVATATFIATWPRLQMRPQEVGTSVSCQCPPGQGEAGPAR